MLALRMSRKRAMSFAWDVALLPVSSAAVLVVETEIKRRA